MCQTREKTPNNENFTFSTSANKNNKQIKSCFSTCKIIFFGGGLKNSITDNCPGETLFFHVKIVEYLVPFVMLSDTLH